MPIWIASSAWRRPAVSMATYAGRVLSAATAAGVDARPIQVPRPFDLRVGGLVLPALQRRLERYASPPGDLVHDTDFQGTCRGVSIGTVHDLWALHRPESLVAWADRDALRMTVRRSRRIVTVSEAVREELRRAFGREPAERARRVWVPFEPVSAERLERRFDVLWIGTTAPRKGLARLLEAARGLPDLSFAVRCNVGPGPDAAPLVEEMRRHPHVTGLLGPLAPDELDRLYRQSTCMVSTSSYEGFQAPVLEAYLRGTRVVVPETGVPAIEPLAGCDGLHLYPPGDRDRLRTTIREAVEAGPLRPSEEVRRRLSFPEIGRQFRAIYEELSPS
ncbi:MAG: glycosyltransferase [Thermoplasmata archaeon]